MKLSIISKLLLIITAITTAFSFGVNIEKQLFEIAISQIESVSDTPIVLPNKRPEVVYLSYKNLYHMFQSITSFTPPRKIRGFCNTNLLDRVYVDKDLDMFLIHSTVLHEFIHILQTLNPDGACLILKYQKDTLNLDEEELRNCIFYQEVQAYFAEEDYKISSGYNILMY